MPFSSCLCSHQPFSGPRRLRTTSWFEGYDSFLYGLDYGRLVRGRQLRHGGVARGRLRVHWLVTGLQGASVVANAIRVVHYRRHHFDIVVRNCFNKKKHDQHYTKTITAKGMLTCLYYRVERISLNTNGLTC